jgi:hypothetical protein
MSWSRITCLRVEASEQLLRTRYRTFGVHNLSEIAKEIYEVWVFRKFSTPTTQFDNKILFSNSLLKTPPSGIRGHTYQTPLIQFLSPIPVIMDRRNFTHTLIRVFHTLKQQNTLHHFLLQTD